MALITSQISPFLLFLLKAIFPIHSNQNSDVEANEQQEKSSKQPVETFLEESEADDDLLEPFLPVIKTIDFDALKRAALRLKLQVSRLTEVQPRSSDQLTRSIDTENPRCGSYNLVYAIQFSDDARWVARFPINSPNFGPKDTEKMDSEYFTMQYIRDSLQLAVPEVFAWHADTSLVGAPFAFMSFVPGVSIMNRWNDREWVTEEKRMKILSNLARYMAALQSPTCDRTGTLRFYLDGAFSHIGPEIEIFIHEDLSDLSINDAEIEIEIDEKPTCSSLDEWLLTDWDPLTGVSERGLQSSKGCLEVVRLALESVPDYLRRTDRFVLEMVDYNYQNIFIDDDCNITGFIDWDHVRAAPQGMGATRYPSWITRDWEPGNYGEPQFDEGQDWGNYGEDSPEQLSKYRQHYAETFASLNLGRGYDPRETKLSQI